MAYTEYILNRKYDLPDYMLEETKSLSLEERIKYLSQKIMEVSLCSYMDKYLSVNTEDERRLYVLSFYKDFSVDIEVSNDLFKVYSSYAKDKVENIYMLSYPSDPSCISFYFRRPNWRHKGKYEDWLLEREEPLLNIQATMLTLFHHLFKLVRKNNTREVLKYHFKINPEVLSSHRYEPDRDFLRLEKEYLI